MPGRRHCRTAEDCQRNILWRRERGLVSQRCSVETKSHVSMLTTFRLDANVVKIKTFFVVVFVSIAQQRRQED